MRQEIRATNLFGLGFEHLDEQPPDGLALLFRIADARQFTEELLGSIDVHQWNIEGAAEQRDDLVRLIEPHQAVIDEYARELIADRLVQEHRGNRTVDAPRQPADDLAIADLRTDLLDLARPEMRHRPVAAKAGDVTHEISQQPRPIGRVHDFRVKLHRIKPPRLVRNGSKRCARRRGNRLEALRQRRHPVAMAHPHLMLFTGPPHALEQRRGLGGPQVRARPNSR